jgi:hypothetical protein
MNNVPLGRATGAPSATAAMRVIRVMLSFILTIGDAVVAGLDLIGSGERPKSITDKARCDWWRRQRSFKSGRDGLARL